MYKPNRCGCLGLDWFYKSYINTLEGDIKELKKEVDKLMKKNYWCYKKKKMWERFSYNLAVGWL